MDQSWLLYYIRKSVLDQNVDFAVLFFVRGADDLLKECRQHKMINGVCLGSHQISTFSNWDEWWHEWVDFPSRLRSCPKLNWLYISEWFEPSCQVEWLYRNLSLWGFYRDVFHISHQHARWSQGTLTYITPKRCKIIITSLQSVLTKKKNKKKTRRATSFAFSSFYTFKSENTEPGLPAQHL